MSTKYYCTKNKGFKSEESIALALTYKIRYDENNNLQDIHLVAIGFNGNCQLHKNIRVIILDSLETLIVYGTFEAYDRWALVKDGQVIDQGWNCNDTAFQNRFKQTVIEDGDVPVKNDYAIFNQLNDDLCSDLDWTEEGSDCEIPYGFFSAATLDKMQQHAAISIFTSDDTDIELLRKYLPTNDSSSDLCIFQCL